ncbi:MAG: hypothetical protein KGQ51_17720 [Planctomycetes bacterium]|nr:hypothetical protein [Planctomycetota bacterium]
MNGLRVINSFQLSQSAALVFAVALVSSWSPFLQQAHAQSAFTIDWTSPQTEYPLGVGVPVPSSCPVRLSMRLPRPPFNVPSYHLVQFEVRPVTGRTFPSDGTVTVRLRGGWASTDQQTAILKIPVRAGTTNAQSEMIVYSGSNNSYWLYIYGEWNGRSYDNLSGQANMVWSNTEGLPMRLRLHSTESVASESSEVKDAFKRYQESATIPYSPINDLSSNAANVNFTGQLTQKEWVADISRMPKSWLLFAHFNDICISLDDFRKLGDAGRSILTKYVWCGGRLEVLAANGPSDLEGLIFANCERNLTPQDPKKQTYQAGLGTVVLGQKTPSADLHILPNSERSRLARLSGDMGTDYWNWLIPEVGKTPIWTFLAMVLLIVGVATPSILIWSRRIQRRVWTILAIPVLSLASVVTLFVYAAVKDGWGSLVRIRSITSLDPDGNGAVWSRHNYFAGTLTDGKIRIDADAEFIPLRTRRLYSSFQYQDETGQDQIYSGILALRQQRQVSIAHSVKDVNLFRMESRIDSESGMPVTKNISELTLLATVCSDDSGRFFRAENVAPGQTIAWQETNLEEAVKWLKSIYEGQGLFLPADAPDSGSRSMFNWLTMPSYGWNRGAADGFQEEKLWQDEFSTWGVDTPRKFVAFVDRAPQLEKCLDGAVETASLHMVVGRWRPRGQKPAESVSQAPESEGKGLQQ